MTSRRPGLRDVSGIGEDAQTAPWKAVCGNRAGACPGPTGAVLLRVRSRRVGVQGDEADGSLGGDRSACQAQDVLEDLCGMRHCARVFDGACPADGDSASTRLEASRPHRSWGHKNGRGERCHPSASCTKHPQTFAGRRSLVDRSQRDSSPILLQSWQS